MRRSRRMSSGCGELLPQQHNVEYGDGGGDRRRGGGPAGAAVNPGQLPHSAVFPALRPRAGRQSTRDEAAIQLHPGSQGHHVEAFLVRDRDRVLGEGSGDFLQRQAVLADLDDVVQPLACSLPIRLSRPISPAPDGPLVEAYEDKIELIAADEAVAIIPGISAGSLRPDLTTIPLHDVEPSHVVLATRAADRSRLVAAFRKSAHDRLTAPALASSPTEPHLSPGHDPAGSRVPETTPGGGPISRLPAVKTSVPLPYAPGSPVWWWPGGLELALLADSDGSNILRVNLG